MCTLVVLTFVVVIGGCTARTPPASTNSGLPTMVAGWRAPTEEETNQDWRNDDANRYLVAHGDFNGDGTPDEARLLVKADGSGMALFAFVSWNGSSIPILLDEIDKDGWLDAMGVSLAPPGRYRTACGKGYVDCEPGEPEELHLQHPAIDYFKEGSANSFFHWDFPRGAFKRTWMSD